MSISGLVQLFRQTFRECRRDYYDLTPEQIAWLALRKCGERP